MKDNQILIGIAIIFSLFFLLLFQFTGLRLIIGFMLLFILPTYLILNLLKLDPLEKTIYSFFLGIGIIPTLVYYLGLLISFRLAMIVVFVVLILIPVFLRTKRK